MTLQIDTKKPLASYTDSEQQAILSRGQAILAEKLEQGHYRSKEDTFCMIAFLRSQRDVKFKPTVEKIVKEKALTKAQKVSIIEEIVKLPVGSELDEKQQQVFNELVLETKEYFIFELPDGSKELIKLTKAPIKQALKDISDMQTHGGIFRGSKKEQVFTEKACYTNASEFLTITQMKEKTNE